MRFTYLMDAYKLSYAAMSALKVEVKRVMPGKTMLACVRKGLNRVVVLLFQLSPAHPDGALAVLHIVASACLVLSACHDACYTCGLGHMTLPYTSIHDTSIHETNVMKWLR